MRKKYLKLGPVSLMRIKWQMLMMLFCSVLLNNKVCALPVPNFQEEIMVKGVVSDEKGPIAGVSVVLKSAAGRGVTTDKDGAYTLSVPKDGVLVFTFIGYKEQVVNVEGKTELNVVLEASDNLLDELTVVAYGVQKKESVVSSISTVKVSELKVPTRSLTNALAGRVAGVIAVQRSGEPGNDDAQFWIRGVSTFGAGSSPLVLVDGIERPLSNIEPEEIETFSVLKDASATAVYGIRGANGVILVNTRKGANKAPSINFKLESGMTSPTQLPKLANAATVYELYNEANLNTNPFFNSQYTPEIIERYKSGVDPILYPDVDWIGTMLKKNARNSRANLNISGGGDVSKYFVSATYYGEDGIWKADNLNAYNTNANLKRYNFRANVDIKLNKYTDLSLGLGGIMITQNFPGRSSDDIWNVIMTTNPGDYIPMYDNPDGSGKVFGGSGNEAVRSPYADLVNTGYQTTWRNNIQSNITLKHDLSRLTRGLNVSGMFAFDADNYHNIQRVRNMGDMYRLTGRDSDGKLILNRYFDGQEDLNFGRQSAGTRRIYTQANINYDRTFSDHTVSALVLFNRQDFVDASAGSSIDALPNRFQGLVGRTTYSYKSRYFAEFSAGYNGSENFPKGSRYGFFPSVALGWIVSEESFFKNNINFIEFFKLRGSFGYKGNDQIGGRRFAYLTTIGGGNGGWRYGLDGGNAYGGKGEDDWGVNLTWEREKETNLGFEARFLKGFYLQADVFNRHRTGIFLSRNALPQILGLTKTPWGNLGEMNNKGVDATLEYRKMVGAFDISLRGNFTFAKNRIIENDLPDTRYAYQDQRGLRFGQPMGLKALGLYKDEEFVNIEQGILRGDLPEPNFGNKVKPGDIKYADINGDGLLDSYDMVPIGNPGNPEIIYGFGTSISFKSFDVSAFLQGSGNMDFMLGGVGFVPFMEVLGRGAISQLATDRWSPGNPSQDVLFPRLSYGQNPNNYQPSTWWQRDASYLRLKSVELGYTLPKSLTTRVKIQTLRVYASGFNLYTWSKFKYWDPELGSGNGAKYPIQKTFNLGVNVNF